jgi:quercetin dioxygenase-like cupin family protein
MICKITTNIPFPKTARLWLAWFSAACITSPGGKGSPREGQEEFRRRILIASPQFLVAGKEGLMITVVYPPGSSDPIHRHNAHAFVYVLEGSIVMQVRGGKEVTLRPGQTFYEGPLMFTSSGETPAKPTRRNS